MCHASCTCSTPITHLARVICPSCHPEALGQSSGVHTLLIDLLGRWVQKLTCPKKLQFCPCLRSFRCFVALSVFFLDVKCAGFPNMPSICPGPIFACDRSRARLHVIALSIHFGCRPASLRASSSERLHPSSDGLQPNCMAVCSNAI